MDTQLYLVGLWTEHPLNYTPKSIIYKEYTVVANPSTFLTDSTSQCFLYFYGLLFFCFGVFYVFGKSEFGVEDEARYFFKKNGGKDIIIFVQTEGF